MKGYGKGKRYPFGLIILFFALMASIVFIQENSYARRVNCDPSVYNPATKTCTAFYCHSNGKGEYRPIKWVKNTPRLDCTGCHSFPPQENMHSKADVDTCGQTCHTQSINNAYTTDYHINGRIEGTYELGEDEQCLECHNIPQGPYPAISPEFQMVSNHIGGHPTDYDCIVCHMEETQEYHQNGKVELKNHQGGPFYSLNQYNQFCLSCHDLGSSLFGQAPFSTGRPIPSIHYELLSKRVQTVENVRFWYPHNHMADKGYDTAQIMNQSGPNSFFYVDTGNQNHILMKGNTKEGLSSRVRYKTDILGGLMGGGGGMSAILSPTMINSVTSPIASNPIIGGGLTMMASPPTAALLATPPIAAVTPSLMGGAVPVAPMTPIMGGGTAIMGAPAPLVGVPSPIMGGGAIIPGGGIMSPGVGATAMLMLGGGNGGMNMVRTGPGNMVMMGPSLSSLIGMPSPMIGMISPMMGMSSPMMGMVNPMMGMPGPMMGIPGPMMGMPSPMMGMVNPMMGMPGPMMGMPNPMMGMPNPMMGMPNPMMGMPNPMMGMPNPMMGMPNPMMGMPGPGMGGMPSPMMGMPGPMMGNPNPMMSMPNPMMNYMPQMGNQVNNMDPTHQTQPNNNTNNPQDQNQQNNEPTETATCLACHPYENPDYLSLSVIANNFQGHFSHQNCIECHTSHGSEFRGLLKQGINWNGQNKSCNVEFCHPTHMHNPPLADTGISYEVRPESTCNTYSCHIGSNQNGMFRLRINLSQDLLTDMNLTQYSDKEIIWYNEYPDN